MHHNHSQLTIMFMFLCICVYMCVCVCECECVCMCDCVCVCVYVCVNMLIAICTWVQVTAIMLLRNMGGFKVQVCVCLCVYMCVYMCVKCSETIFSGDGLLLYLHCIHCHTHFLLLLPFFSHVCFVLFLLSMCKFSLIKRLYPQHSIYFLYIVNSHYIYNIISM